MVRYFKIENQRLTFVTLSEVVQVYFRRKLRMSKGKIKKRQIREFPLRVLLSEKRDPFYWVHTDLIKLIYQNIPTRMWIT